MSSSILKKYEYTCEGCGVVFLNPTKPEDCTLCKQVNILKENAKEGKYGLFDEDDDDNNVNALFNEEINGGVLAVAHMSLLSAEATINKAIKVLGTWLQTENNLVKDKQQQHCIHYIDTVCELIDADADEDPNTFFNMVKDMVTHHENYKSSNTDRSWTATVVNKQTMQTSIALANLRALNAEMLKSLPTDTKRSILDAAVFEAIATTLNIIDEDETPPANVTALEACTAVYANNCQYALKETGNNDLVEEGNNDSKAGDKPAIDTVSPEDVVQLDPNKVLEWNLPSKDLLDLEIPLYNRNYKLLGDIFKIGADKNDMLMVHYATEDDDGQRKGFMLPYNTGPFYLLKSRLVVLGKLYQYEAESDSDDVDVNDEGDNSKGDSSDTQGDLPPPSGDNSDTLVLQNLTKEKAREITNSYPKNATSIDYITVYSNDGNNKIGRLQKMSSTEKSIYLVDVNDNGNEVVKNVNWPSSSKLFKYNKNEVNAKNAVPETNELFFI